MIEEWWAAWHMYVFVFVLLYSSVLICTRTSIYNERCAAWSLLCARWCAFPCVSVSVSVLLCV